MVILSTPTTVIDPSDEDLFKLAKAEADDNFDGDNHELLILMLVRKHKMLRFCHDFINEKLYIDFPDADDYDKKHTTQ